jgi:hypothetical protein
MLHLASQFFVLVQVCDATMSPVGAIAGNQKIII